MAAQENQAHRRDWNKQESVLRRLLFKDKDYVQALPLFLCQHEAMHSTRLHRGVPWSFQDQVLNGLTVQQMRCLPKGCSHSVVWLLWHMTRCEDVTMNILLADSQQILHSGNWLNKLETDYVGVGNEKTKAEAVKLSGELNVKALLAYRLAVGKRTRAVVRHIKPEQLAEYPAPERLARIAEEGAVTEKSSWLVNYWGGHPNANLLMMPATRHCFVHLNEIDRMLPKIKRMSAAI